MTTTVEDIAANLKCDYWIALAIINLLHKSGVGKCINFQNQKRGRPRKVWTLPSSITINFETGEIS